MHCYEKTTPQQHKEQTQLSKEQLRQLQWHKERLFLTHFHFLVSHSEQIFSASRMFFAPIPIASGLAISGHVKQVTLGIFIEWLLHYPPSTKTDNRDKVWLVCRLSGSGLSNGNLCTFVDSEGNTKKEYIPDFYKAVRTLVNIKNRYKNVVNLSQSYTIEQVIYRLKYPTLIRYFGDIFHKKTLKTIATHARPFRFVA